MRGGEQGNHYSILTPLGIQSEETIHCGLIRGKKLITQVSLGVHVKRLWKRNNLHRRPRATLAAYRDRKCDCLWNFTGKFVFQLQDTKSPGTHQNNFVFLDRGAGKGAELQDELKLDLIWRLFRIATDCLILKLRRCQTSNGFNIK